MRILILNGPNLNLLGTRQPEIYGATTLADVEAMCAARAGDLGIDIDFRQSNYEGELVTWIQESKGVCDALIINAGAYTHTSIAIHDAILSVEIPTLELHLSNIKERETFRHLSYIERVAFDGIMGHGPDGYVMALERVVAHLNGSQADKV